MAQVFVEMLPCGKQEPVYPEQSRPWLLWPGNARNQGISSHSTDLVRPEHSGSALKGLWNFRSRKTPIQCHCHVEFELLRKNHLWNWPQGPNSMEISFCYHPSCSKVIVSIKFSTWHDGCPVVATEAELSWAMVACEHFCSNTIPCNGITLKLKLDMNYNG